MAKQCDNKSVGLLIEDDRGRYGLISRINYPRAIAPIAGHVEPHGSEKEAIVAEAREEGGLKLENFVQLWEGDIKNPCKREGGDHHYWTVYGAYNWLGEFRASSDAKEARWVTPEELKRLTERTERFMQKFGIPYEDVSTLTKAIFGDSQSPQTDPEWEESPGLEPVWYYIFKQIGKI